MRRALIFDCDGVLADTELDGHLPAFNRTFADLRVPMWWSPEEYGRLLSVGGGKERILHSLTPGIIRKAGLSTEPDRLSEEVARWHAHKVDIFKGMIADGTVKSRSGVRRLTEEAVKAGWSVAVASTSDVTSVQAVLGIAVGTDLSEAVHVFAGDIVERKKPAPDVYLAALDHLGVSTESAVAIEDSRNGLLAAVGAGLACVITRSAYTQGEIMDEASIVVSELGDPGLAPPEVQCNRTSATVRPYLTLTDIEACLGTAANPTT